MAMKNKEKYYLLVCVDNEQEQRIRDDPQLANAVYDSHDVLWNSIITKDRLSDYIEVFLDDAIQNEIFSEQIIKKLNIILNDVKLFNDFVNHVFKKLDNFYSQNFGMDYEDLDSRLCDYAVRYAQIACVLPGEQAVKDAKAASR